MLPRTIRVKFTKTGALQFISHLDLQRFMKRAILRAGVPIVFTEGFNPHPKTVFALPLSIGTQSVCELMEIRIEGDMPCEEIASRLSAAFPPEMRVLSVCEATDKKISSVAYAEYEITVDREIDPKTTLTAPLVVKKNTKSGEKEVDIAPQIKKWSYFGRTLRVTLCADSQNYLNPELVVRLFDVTDYSITRTKLLCADGETEFR